MKSHLTYEEFNDVVEIIKACAYAAFNESRLEIRRSSKHKKAISEDEINEYIDVYVGSNYTYCEKKTYLNYVKRELKTYVPQYLHKSTDYEKRSEIILPVVIYSLIIRNEGNPTTVAIRADKVMRSHKKDQEKSVDEDENVIHWQKQNPYRPYREVYYGADPINQQSNQIRKVIKSAQQSNFFYSDFISQSAIEVIRQLHHLDGNMHIIKAMESMSRAGQLLNDFLKTKHSDKCQLDTILRLYCATLIHDVIQASRMLTDENTTIVVDGEINFKKYECLDIVWEYTYNQLGYDLADNMDMYSFPISFKQGYDSSNIKCFKNTPVKKGEKFKTYYKFLTNTFDFTFPNIIDFYLNKEKLAPYTEALSQLEKYIELQEKLIGCLPSVDGKEPSLNILLSSINLIKDRKDVVAKQRFISQYQSEAEEKRALEEIQEEQWQNCIAAPQSLYDTLEYQCFCDDSYDDELTDKESVAEYGEHNEDPWGVLEDELFDMFYKLSYQKRDYVYDPKQREYLRNQIRDKLERAQNIEKQKDK